MTRRRGRGVVARALSVIFFLVALAPCQAIGGEFPFGAISVQSAEGLLRKLEPLDPVEGIWKVYQTWAPACSQPREYPILIIRNNTKIKKNWDYLGIGLEDKAGVKPGEVKLLMRRDASSPTLFHGAAYFSAGFGRGVAEGPMVLRDGFMDAGLAMGGNRPFACLIKQ